VHGQGGTDAMPGLTFDGQDMGLILFSHETGLIDQSGDVNVNSISIQCRPFTFTPSHLPGILLLFGHF
jgi:hypothetical protein